MTTVTVNDVYEYIDKIAPFCMQDKYDNSGLIIGGLNQKAGRILICLDITKDVIDEAVKFKADLIISHHPVIFHPVKKLTNDEPPALLIKNNISAICAHTNLDVACDGVSDIMLQRLGLSKSDTAIEQVGVRADIGYGRIAELDKTVTAVELSQMTKNAFGCSVVKYVDGGKSIRRIGVQSGSGSSIVELACEKGCDALICGDVKWDKFVFAKNYGLTLIDAGHFHTEDIICEVLRDKLRSRFPDAVVEKAGSGGDICGYV